MMSEFMELWLDEATWSDRTFGIAKVRGPIGPLKHLEKEAREAQARPDDIIEYADCLLLVMDSARRAGFTCSALLASAREKLEINKRREWPKAANDEPVSHVKD